MPIEKAIVLLSGGLDSAVSFFLISQKYEISRVLTVDYGQRAKRREIKAAQSLCAIQNTAHQIIDLPWLREITHTALVNLSASLPELNLDQLDDLPTTSHSASRVWVPNRNGVFVHIAAAFADAHKATVIITGFNREEAATFPDNSLSFLETVNQSLAFSTQVQARLESPTISMDKEEIVREGLKINFPFEEIWSCYEGGEVMCGACESCLRSQRAFEMAGIGERMKGKFKS